MGEFSIQKYNVNRDKGQIEGLLFNNNYLMNRFYKDEESNRDNILVVLHDSKLIGFLSSNGFSRKPRATLGVRIGYEVMKIGSMLIDEYENVLIHNDKVEHTIFACHYDDIELNSLLEKKGYRLYLSEYIMERVGKPYLPENIFVRNYEEKDYFQWDRICELAFYHMRQRIGIYPSFFYKPVEWEREKFAKNKDNEFVMIVNNTIVAIGEIEGNRICFIAVSIEHQSQGYGRAFIKFLINEIIHRGEEKVTLEVAKGNFAKTLYEGLGFEEMEFYQHYVKYFRPETRLSAPPEDY